MMVRQLDIQTNCKVEIVVWMIFQSFSNLLWNIYGWPFLGWCMSRHHRMVGHRSIFSGTGCSVVAGRSALAPSSHLLLGGPMRSYKSWTLEIFFHGRSYIDFDDWPTFNRKFQFFCLDFITQLWQSSQVAHGDFIICNHLKVVAEIILFG